MKIKIKTKPLTEHERGLLQAPPIASQLPIVFNADYKFEELSAHCKNCGGQVPDKLLRGVVTKLSESLATIDALAVCPKCRIGTPIHYRFHDDGRVSGYSPTTGRWTEWKMHRPNLLEYISSVFGKLWNLLLFRA